MMVEEDEEAGEVMEMREDATAVAGDSVGMERDVYVMASDEEDDADFDDTKTLLSMRRKRQNATRKPRKKKNNNELSVTAKVAVCVLVFVSVIILLIVVKVALKEDEPETVTEKPEKKEPVARTPPMGWNSWNHFQCDGLNEDLVKQVVDILVSSGLAEAGYVYVNLDDCWQFNRNSSGHIQADVSRFPSGIPSLSRYIHDKGLKFGIYTDVGSLTCQRRPGSYGMEEIDAQTYADWGVDYIKNDDCYVYPSYTVAKDYRTMWGAIQKTGRPMVHSIKATFPIDHAYEASHVRRIGWDIEDAWEFVIAAVQQANEEDLWKYVRPKLFWNDFDMLEVGNGGMTQDNYVAHMALWCAFKSPLLMGNDLSKLDNFTLQLLIHDELLAVLNDPLGTSVQLVSQTMTPKTAPIKPVTSQPCSAADLYQQWKSQDSGLLVNRKTNTCLSVGSDNYLFAVNCELANISRVWSHVKNTQKIHLDGNQSECIMLSKAHMGQSTLRPCEDSSLIPLTLDFSSESDDKPDQNKWFSIRHKYAMCASVNSIPETDIYVGTLSNSSHVVVFLNRDLQSQTIELLWDHLHWPRKTLFKFRDLYRRIDLGEFKNNFTSTLNPQSAAIFKLSPVS